MNTVRISIVSLAMCSLFASSVVRADDCSDALVAESCACRSDARSDREQRRSSEKNARQRSQSKTSKTARSQVPQRAKNTVVPVPSQAQR